MCNVLRKNAICEKEAMTYLLTAAQMRGIERDAIESGTVTGLELMERAGRGAVDAILARWPALRAATAAILCGPGNNGGDGYVVARLLRELGWSVTIYALGDPAQISGDARINADRWAGPVASLDDLPQEWACDLVVDALFGTGLTRPVEGQGPLFRRINEAVAQSRGPAVAALDLPSGLCADSGRILAAGDDEAAAAAAHLTISFHALKRGHVLGAGPARCGTLAVVDIGLNPPSDEAGIAHLVAAPRAATLAKSPFAHKFDHGHALVLSGGVGKGGAARMAARAALRIGAGLVTLGCPPAALIENAARLDAIMLRRIDDAEALTDLLGDGRITALLLGPGLGVDDRGAALVEAALRAGRPTLLDADALTLIANEGALRDLVHPGCVLTPHPGEFGRLFPDLSARLRDPAVTGPAFSAIDAAADAARGIGATILLKGPATVVADGEGAVRVNDAVFDRAVPWLATAGAGDVLSGLVAGLLARGMPPFEAASMAARLHTDAAQLHGPGLIAEDLPEILPRLLRDMGA